MLAEQDAARVALLAMLATGGYDFITPTNATHRAYLRRATGRRAAGLRDVFGWSLPFGAADIAPEILDLMVAGDLLARRGAEFRSRVRVSAIAESLFLHSAFPAAGRRAVFLGPDSYRFANFITQALDGMTPCGPVVDIGAGAGVGAVAVARTWPGVSVTLADINPDALSLARVNADFAGIKANILLSDGLTAFKGPIGLAVANPPYLFSVPGLPGRIYRDGGGLHGAEISIEWAKAAAARLIPGGRILLYTGSAVIAGRDRLREALATEMDAAGCAMDYREIDPDVFGGLLSHPAYWGVERIAAVGMTAIKA